MYAGFPDLPLAPPPAALDEEFELENVNGCVKKLILPHVRSVQLSYPALCHLLSLSTEATTRRAVFGRIFGLQVNEEVHITEVHANPRRHTLPERGETMEEQKKRREKEEEMTQTAFDALSAMHHKEELDTYQTGSFVIGSATFNPFSTTLLKQLMSLYVRGQPMVMIYYDPFRSGIFGRPYLRGFVPTQEYLNYFGFGDTGPNDAKLSKYIKDSKVTTHGVLREVPVSVDVDPFQKLGLAQVVVPPLGPNFSAIHSDAASDYLMALVHSVSTNTDNVVSSLNNEGRANIRYDNQNAPLAQRIDTLLALHHLREQAAHLEAVCDSVLINASMLRDL